jgi:hypothetical protein
MGGSQAIVFTGRFIGVLKQLWPMPTLGCLLE